MSAATWPPVEHQLAQRAASARRRQAWRVYLGFGALLLGALIAAPLVGSTRLHLDSVLDRSTPFADNLDAQIFFIARLPRVLAAAVVGGTLAVAGVVMQALLRNPLATPFTLGVSAGSALGAMLAITLLPTWTAGGFTAVPLASLAGALGAVLIVYGLAQVRHRGFSTDVLLLAGVTLNAFFSALILLVQYLSDFTQTIRTLRWLMGDLDVGGYQPLLTALPLLLVAGGVFAWLARSLNVLALGAELAGTRGVPVLTVQRLAFFGASLATGVAVSLAGPIGFVGIIVPHLVRLLVGADHRVVMPASALFGAAFLMACDALARVVLSPVELPVGVVTAVLGAPFFLWLLIRKT
ncbi:MAG: iron ABC transporter permease [Acidobacteria bacterium]|nr:iron ABC transporter permease [Acidobacteriota bacterium]